MKLSPQEKAAHRAAFQAMSPGKKLEHILTYYKAPILLALLLLFILGSVVHRQLTQKEELLYLGLLNVSIGEELEEGLNEGYLRSAGLDETRQEVYLYRDLYLSDNADVVNHEYAYASRMKVMGAIQANKLDLVLMNREAYDLFSRNGYLMALDAWLPGIDAAEALSPYLVSNTVILEDNTIAYQLGEAASHELVTEEVKNGLDVSRLPLIASAGFPEATYLGVLANCERLDACADYLAYLAAGSEQP